MKYLLKIKKHILSFLVSDFKYKYEYESPFGEYWLIYRIYFGFFPIKYMEYSYIIKESRNNNDEVEEYVNQLNLKISNNFQTTIFFDF